MECFFLFVDTCKATLKDLLVSFLHSEKKKVALGKILEGELGVCKSALPASLGPGAPAAQELVSKESILQSACKVVFLHSSECQFQMQSCLLPQV